MSTSIDLHLSQIRFPHLCVVCMLPATRAHQIQKVIFHKRSSYTVRVDVPMCTRHFEAASVKATTEKRVGQIGVTLGILAGLGVTILYPVLWRGTGSENLLPGFFADSLYGIVAFTPFWAVISFILAPLFTDPDSKAARRAVRFTQYWPKDQYVRLTFQNEHIAEIVRNADQPRSVSRVEYTRTLNSEF